jgi:hypothetical protein
MNEFLRFGKPPKGGTDSWPEIQQGLIFPNYFKDLDSGNRANELNLAAWCLEDWPTNFNRAAERCKTGHKARLPKTA